MSVGQIRDCSAWDISWAESSHVFECESPHSSSIIPALLGYRYNSRTVWILYSILSAGKHHVCFSGLYIICPDLFTEAADAFLFLSGFQHFWLQDPESVLVISCSYTNKR